MIKELITKSGFQPMTTEWPGGHNGFISWVDFMQKIHLNKSYCVSASILKTHILISSCHKDISSPAVDNHIVSLTGDIKS